MQYANVMVVVETQQQLSQLTLKLNHFENKIIKYSAFVFSRPAHTGSDTDSNPLAPECVCGHGRSNCVVDSHILTTVLVLFTAAATLALQLGSSV